MPPKEATTNVSLSSLIDINHLTPWPSVGSDTREYVYSYLHDESIASRKAITSVCRSNTFGHQPRALLLSSHQKSKSYGSVPAAWDVERSPPLQLQHTFPRSLEQDCDSIDHKVSERREQMVVGMSAHHALFEVLFFVLLGIVLGCCLALGWLFASCSSMEYGGGVASL